MLPDRERAFFVEMLGLCGPRSRKRVGVTMAAEGPADVVGAECATKRVVKKGLVSAETPDIRQPFLSMEGLSRLALAVGLCLQIIQGRGGSSAHPHASGERLRSRTAAEEQDTVMDRDTVMQSWSRSASRCGWTIYETAI